jgi:hypothetical protein
MISIYLQQNNLSEYDSLEGNIYVSKFKDLTLQDYVDIRAHICASSHKQPCYKQCEKLLKVAKEILTAGFLTLKNAFKLCSPTLKYNAVNARRKLLQMPLAVVGTGDKFVCYASTDSENHLWREVSSKIEQGEFKKTSQLNRVRKRERKVKVCSGKVIWTF